MSDRWALYIDVEGFGAKWDETTMLAFRGINSLMEGIFRIGSNAFAEPPHRIFAHQFGDAFLIVSDFHEENLDRAALVGIALMRHLLTVGEVAKCALAEGELSDVANCYPEAIRSQYEKGHIGIGSGIMTVTPVMGSALIRAVSLQKGISGPLMILPAAVKSRISPDFALSDINSRLSLNWLRGEPNGLNALQAAAGLAQGSESERVSSLERYISSNQGLKDNWRANASTYLLRHGA
jgi:hypothetical protein